MLDSASTSLLKLQSDDAHSLLPHTHCLTHCANIASKRRKRAAHCFSSFCVIGVDFRAPSDSASHLACFSLSRLFVVIVAGNGASRGDGAERALLLLHSRGCDCGRRRVPQAAAETFHYLVKLEITGSYTPLLQHSPKRAEVRRRHRHHRLLLNLIIFHLCNTESLGSGRAA